MKVFELSKDLDIPNKELIGIIQGLGIEVKSHLNVLTDEDIAKVKSAIKNVPATKPIPAKWEPDLQRMICIENISRGKLIYVSKRQLGYMVEWPQSGDIVHLELEEFINLKNTDRRFVIEPWIRIREDDEIEILKYANVYKYYEDIIEIKDARNILLLDFEDFKTKFDKLPRGYKTTIAEMTAQMVNAGELDSIRIKEHIENELDIELDMLVKE